MTASRAFRSDASIRPALRERITRLAGELGYEPSPQISSVMRAFVRRSHPEYRETLAFVGSREPAPSSWDFSLFESARRRAESLGYGMEPFWMRSRRLSFSRLGRLLRDRSIRGVVLLPFLEQAHMHVRLDWPRIASATIGSSLWKPRIHRVQHHHYMGMILALRSIRRLSRGKVGLVLSNLLHSRTQGAYVSPFLTNQSGSSRDLAGCVHRYAKWEATRFRIWLERTKPEVILCAEPADVALVREALPPRWRKAGIACLDVPEGVPDLAGVEQHSGVIAEHAVDLVLGELRLSQFGLPVHPKTMMVEGSWRDGTSLG